jgi:IclR family KDG regulon transcriptional repressor
MARPSPIKGIDRLVAILDCFDQERPQWSRAELCAHLDLAESRLDRFLGAMEQQGILTQDARHGHWRPGPRLATWGCRAARATGLVDVAQAEMAALVAATSETVVLTAYRDGAVICVDKIESRQSIRLVWDKGALRAPHAGASSKVLMAYLPPDEIQAIINKSGLPSVCVHTITEPEGLLAELAKIRTCGYATSIEETHHNAWGIAAPIRGRDGSVVSALGVAGPTSRFSPERTQECVALCRRAADRVSTVLRRGCLPPEES